MARIGLGSLLLASLLAYSLPTAAAAAGKIVIAHRGASGYLPEHTLPGAAMAYAMGADYIEPDLVLTKDDVLVVLHDIHLEATTNVAQVFPTRKRADGRWYAADFSLAEIKTLRVHERVEVKDGKVVFPSRFPVETLILSVPTFEELIQLVQGLNRSTGRRVGLYPELKSPAWHKQEGKDIAKIALALLSKYGYADAKADLYLQCFDPATLKYVRRELKSTLKLVQLIGENEWNEAPNVDYKAMQTEAGVKEIATYADGIGPSIAHVISKIGVPTELVKLAHAAKLFVHPYTVRSDQLPPLVSVDMMHGLLFQIADVDGVFSDFTDKTVAYLQDKGLRSAAN